MWRCWAECGHACARGSYTSRQRSMGCTVSARTCTECGVLCRWCSLRRGCGQICTLITGRRWGRCYVPRVQRTGGRFLVVISWIPFARDLVRFSRSEFFCFLWTTPVRVQECGSMLLVGLVELVTDGHEGILRLFE